MSIMDQDVPAPILGLLKDLKAKFKQNNEASTRFTVDATDDGYKLHTDITAVQEALPKTTRQCVAFQREGKAFVSQIQSRDRYLKTLMKMGELSKVQPGYASDSLLQLLSQASDGILGEISKVNDLINELEEPLRDYIHVKDGFRPPQMLTKKDLFMQVARIVLNSDAIFMKSTKLHDRVEFFKKAYLEFLCRLHNRYVPSPFDAAESTTEFHSRLFEYEANGPNLFPSSAALMSLADYFPKAGAQSNIGGFGSQLPGNSMFGPRPAGAAPAFGFGGATSTASPFKPFNATATSTAPATNTLFGSTSTGTTGSLFGNTTSSAATGTTGSLFNTTTTAASTGTTGSLFGTPASTTATPSLFGGPAKQPFQPLAATTSTASPFGSTLNSTISGTLFGGSASKSIFGK